MAWPRDPVETYKFNQVTSASAPELILIAYDAALAACGRQDLLRTTRALNVLRGAVDPDHGPLAIQLMSIYQYCGDLARQRKYDEASKLLRDLRDTWAAAATAHAVQSV
jgi:flagellin-specific chaperone FliS